MKSSEVRDGVLVPAMASRGEWNLVARLVSLCLVMLVCIVTLGMTGCASITLWKHKDPALSKADPPLSAKSSAEEILARVNENAYSEYSPDGLKSYRSDDVRVRMKGVPAPMRASIVVEAPRNLRLRVAHPLTSGEAVDLGSNEQEFWFWAKDSQPANVLVCSHDQIAAATQVTTLPLPFRPDWLMEVLGVVPISGSGYEVRRANPRSPIVELVSVQRTPDQQPVRRIIKVNMTYGVVLEHRVESTNGKMIAKATLSRHFRDPGTRLILPRQISIDWPAAGQELALSLEFTSVDFNTPEESVAMWSVPKMPGFPEFDIGAYAVKQLGGQEFSDPGNPDLDQESLAGHASIDDDSEPQERDNESAAGEMADAGDWSEESSDELQALEATNRPTRTVSVDDGDLASPEQPAVRLGAPIEGDSPEDGSQEEASGNARPFPN